MKNKKIVVISDTHGDHRMLKLPEGEVLIHCGDFSAYRNDGKIMDFFGWLSGLDYEHVLVVPGNHDFQMESYSMIQLLEKTFEGVEILIDRAIKINGVAFYGTPYQPNYKSFAFNRSEMELQILYSQIPKDTDILITHCPPKGILDEHAVEGSLGSQSLLNAVAGLINLKYHVFGHIHESRGMFNNTFINASYDKNKPYWEIKL